MFYLACVLPGLVLVGVLLDDLYLGTGKQLSCLVGKQLGADKQQVLWGLEATSPPHLVAATSVCNHAACRCFHISMEQLSRCLELVVVGDWLIDGGDQPTDKDTLAWVTALREVGSCNEGQLLDVLDTRVGLNRSDPIDDVGVGKLHRIALADHEMGCSPVLAIPLAALEDST